MTTIMGKAVFRCPKTGADVTLDKDCLNCDEFEHWGFHGGRPFISCKAAMETEEGFR